MKFVIIALDGMRPDLVGPDLTPNLHGFASAHCRFTNHFCTFPSETYVNTTSLVTGAPPAVHGLVANVFCESTTGRAPWFKGFEVESIERLSRAGQGGLFLSPSAGEILGRAKKTMAVISTNSAGSARLMHHRVNEFNHLNLCPHSLETSSPQERVKEITSRFGRPGEKSIPDLEGVTFATDVFLDHLVPQGLPDLTFLWYGEPDNTFHMNGIGSPANQEALNHTDAQLGRVLEWWQTRGKDKGVQLLVLSDHGHLTIREKVSVAGQLREAGFSLADNLGNGAQVALLDGLSTNLLVREGDPGLFKAVSQALMEASWLGSLFMNNNGPGRVEVEGALPLDLTGAGNIRSPHLAWTFRSDNQPNQYGHPGQCCHDIGLPVGGSMHGGLHPMEMRCLLLAGGRMFKPEFRVANPTNIVDVMPTILHGLGIEPPQSMTGRVLAESFSHADHTPEVIWESLIAGAGQFQQYLKLVRVDGRTFPVEGGREA